MHRRDLLHQQIHPDNVLVDTHGQVVLADFSACRLREGDGHKHSRELARQLGLTEHSAPEYALDDDVGRRSDQYALASTIYWLVTGGLPYDMPPHQLRSHTDLEQLSYKSARSLNPEVPQALDDALRRALDPQRALRFRRLSELVVALREPRNKGEAVKATSSVSNRFWQGLAGLLLALLVISWLMR